VSGTPGGRLPLATTHFAPFPIVSTALTIASMSSSVSRPPGSLIFVTVPSGSTRLTFDRV